MSDLIFVMRSGLVEQTGTPGEIYDYPRTAFVADFVGSANVVDGEVLNPGAANGSVTLRVDGESIIQGVAHGRSVARNGTLSLRTVHLKLSAERPPAEANVWPATVLRSVFLGDITQVHVQLGRRELIARQTGPCPVADGQPAFLRIDPKHCVLLDA